MVVTVSSQRGSPRQGVRRPHSQHNLMLPPAFLTNQAPWNKDKDGPEDASGAPQPAAAVGPPPGPESIEGMSVGQRCECMPGSRRGTVMFLGEAETVGEGYWVSPHPWSHEDRRIGVEASM